MDILINMFFLSVCWRNDQHWTPNATRQVAGWIACTLEPATSASWTLCEQWTSNLWTSWALYKWQNHAILCMADLNRFEPYPTLPTSPNPKRNHRGMQKKDASFQRPWGLWGFVLCKQPVGMFNVNDLPWKATGPLEDWWLTGTVGRCWKKAHGHQALMVGKMM